MDTVKNVKSFAVRLILWKILLSILPVMVCGALFLGGTSLCLAYPSPSAVFCYVSLNSDTGEQNDGTQTYTYNPQSTEWTCPPNLSLRPGGVFGPWIRCYDGIFYDRVGGSVDSPVGFYVRSWNNQGVVGMVYGAGQGGFHWTSNPGGAVALTKEPINVIDGAVIQDQTDVEINSPGLPLVFARHYDSQLAYQGSLGSQWTHSYDWFLTTTNVVESGVTNFYCIMQTGLGERLWFKGYGTNAFSSPFGSTWAMDKLSNGFFMARSPEAMFYQFDTNGILTAISEAFGNTLMLSYTNAYPNQRLVAVTNGNQHGLQFTYASNKLVSVSSPSTNLFISFTYGGQGELTSAATHLGAGSNVTRYAYSSLSNSWHCLTQMVNAAEHEFSYGYDTNSWGVIAPRGNAMSVGSNYYSHAVSYGNNGSTRQTTVTYHRGDTNQVFVYEFQPAIRQIEKISGPAGNDITTTYERDVGGNPLSTTVSNLVTGDFLREELTRDERCHVTSKKLGYLATPTNTWFAEWNTNWDTIASSTDPEGHRTEWDYTNASISVERIYPATNQPVETHYAYTSNGLLAAVTNANGHWINYKSDACGYPTQTVSQAGTTNWMTWDILGHLKEVRLPSHQSDTNDPPNMIPRVISFDPNELGWVKKITYPDNTFETFAFDAIGNLTNHVDVAGQTNSVTWLPTRKLSSSTRYLSAGGSNQAVTIQIAYDQQMNAITIKDELGRTVESYQLDLQDRPISVTNVDSQVMGISWGLKDMVSRIVRFDGTTNTLAYDGGARVSQISYPDDSLFFRYYKNDLPMTASNRLGIVSNAFDGANRLTAQTQPVPNGSVAYGYYPAGQLSNAVTVAGTNTYVLDAGERIQTLKVSSPGKQDSLAYTYDNVNGMMKGTSYSNGLSCSYSYDVMDRLTGMSWLDASNRVLKSRSYTYTTAGMISNITYETGEKAMYSYDSLDRLTREKHTDYYGQVISDEKYDYDLAGNRTKKTILDATGANLLTVNYSLSTGNRLGSWTVAETNLVAQFSVLGYASDPIGTNDRFGYLWVSNSANAVVKPYVSGTNFFAFDLTVGMGTQYVYAAIRDVAGNTTYVTNRFYPTCLTNGAYQHNAAGCLTNFQYTGKDYSQTLGLTWNGQYQLTAATTNGVAAEQYGYDAAGRRIFIVQGGTTNWMVYDGNQVVAEVDGSGNLNKSYVYGPGIDNPISMTVYGTTTNTYYYLKDHLNSVLALTDGNGAVVETYRYDAWGRVLGVYNANGSQIDESAVGNRILWQGREYSWKTGLYYFRARWYEPVTGRWLSNDPIGISGGLNQYQAFKSNPVNFRDPSGLCTETFGHAYSRNYDKILANLYGADLEWADLLGFWGIGALAAEVVVDASVSVVEAMAAEQVINSRIAGAMQGGDIFARTAAAEAGAQVGARTVILQSAMRGVGAATGVVGFGATGYSAGARLNAATRSIIQTIQERRRRP